VGYFKLKRAQWTLAGFLITALLLRYFPGIDLAVSKLFFDEAFHSSTNWWAKDSRKAVDWFLSVSIVSAVAAFIFNRWAGRNLWDMHGRKVCYLLLVLAIGAGLVVNVMLKDHFGRARPRDIVEFGGPKQFTPAFVISHECARNCSFPSGEAAAAFFSLALATALRRKRALFLAGILFATLVSLSRLAVGAHFFSDILVSFFVMWILSDVLSHYMLSAESRHLYAQTLPGRSTG
jgi:lipid A 4'-phosphatase